MRIREEREPRKKEACWPSIREGAILSLDAPFDFPSIVYQATNFFATIVALCPPKPNELFNTALTVISRAVFGT